MSRTLRDRLPQDLKEGPRGPDFATVPFVAVYQTEGVRRRARQPDRSRTDARRLVPDATGETHRGVMTALVRPNGLFGKAYMAAIKPTRRTLVYPGLIRAIGKEWPQYT